MRKFLAALCVLGLLAALVPAAPASTAYAEYDNDVDEAAVVLDALLVRPLGLASIVIGTGVFIISLPFTLPTRSVGVAADKLLAEPFKFTFTRPIGEVQD
jgi:hypothetical protein